MTNVNNKWISVPVGRKYNGIRHLWVESTDD